MRSRSPRKMKRSLLQWPARNKGCVRQTLVCCSVSILPLIHGMLMSWPSLAIDKLMHGVTGFRVSGADISTIVAVLNLSMFLMPILFGFILLKLGRKTNLLLNSLIYIVGWTMLTFASSSRALVVANLVSGLGSAIAIIIGPIYIAEIADKRIRGALISLYITAVAIGEAVLTTVGIFISYFELNAMTLILAVIAFFSIIAFATESPCWHFMCNREEEAEKSFRYFADATLDEKESEVSTAMAFTELKETVEAEMRSVCSFRELFRTPNVSSLIIITALSFFQAATGISAMLAYASTTLPKYNGFWRPNPTMALVNWLDLIFNVISIGLIDRWGRRPLSIISNAGNALGTGLIATYFFIDEHLSIDSSNIKWLPYVGIVVFICFYGVAMATIPHILVGELFPANVRYHASVVSMCCISAGFAFFNYTYSYVCNTWGVDVMYLVYTLFNTSAALFSYFYVFETKNLSLAEIQVKAMEHSFL